MREDDDDDGSTVIRAPSSIYKNFKRFVLARYGERFKNGCYMIELGKAMERYMAVEKVSSTHTHAQNLKLITKNNIPPKISKLRDKVIDYLVTEYNYEDLGIKQVRVNLNHLKQAITYCTNSKGEYRTIKPWIESFQQHRIIREEQGLFVFLIDGGGGGAAAGDNEEEEILQKERVISNKQRQKTDVDKEIQDTFNKMGI